MPISDEDTLRSTVLRLAERPGGTIGHAREDVRRRIVRRRRRRRTILGLAVGLCAVGAVAFVPRGDREAVVVVGPAAGSETTVPSAEILDEATAYLTLESMGGTGGSYGTETAVFYFDSELPDVPIYLVEDVTSPEPSGISYTTQADPGSINVCGSVHSFPGGGTGSVDLLLPGDWFEPGVEIPQPQPIFENPAEDATSKVAVCRTNTGFIQISIWAPVSDAPGDIAVSIDGASLAVEISPPG